MQNALEKAIDSLENSKQLENVTNVRNTVCAFSNAFWLLEHDVKYSVLSLQLFTFEKYLVDI